LDCSVELAHRGINRDSICRPDENLLLRSRIDKVKRERDLENVGGVAGGVCYEHVQISAIEDLTSSENYTHDDSYLLGTWKEVEDRLFIFWWVPGHP
jgi:hypothetical protein